MKLLQNVIKLMTVEILVMRKVALVQIRKICLSAQKVLVSARTKDAIFIQTAKVCYLFISNFVKKIEV